MKKTRRTIRRKKQTRRRKQKAGMAKLGEGAYAKVIYPAIPCKGKDTSKYASKVFNPDEEILDGEELSDYFEGLKTNPVFARLKEIDPEQKYFVYPEFCTEMGELTEENKKDGVTDEMKQYSYLIKKGGKSLKEEFEAKAGEVDDYVAYLKPIVTDVFAKLKILHDNGIIHGDFHTANVIRMDDGTTRIIDFDRSKVFDPVVIAKLQKYDRARMKVDDGKENDKTDFLEYAVGDLDVPEKEMMRVMEKLF